MREGNVELLVDGVLYEMRPSTKKAILEILAPCPIIVQKEDAKPADYDKPTRENPPENEKPKPPTQLHSKPKKGGMFRRNVS